MRSRLLPAALLSLALLIPSAAAALHCTKGTPCGNACIAKGKACHLGAAAATNHTKRYCTTCPRDSHGRIQRSSSARRAFLKSQGLTHTPKGCQVDHIKPLAKGGSDTPANMQLLCGEALKEKEATELK